MSTRNQNSTTESNPKTIDSPFFVLCSFSFFALKPNQLVKVHWRGSVLRCQRVPGGMVITGNKRDNEGHHSLCRDLWLWYRVLYHLCDSNRRRPGSRSAVVAICFGSNSFEKSSKFQKKEPHPKTQTRTAAVVGNSRIEIIDFAARHRNWNSTSSRI